MDFKFEPGKLDGVKIVYPFYIRDERGYFLKSFERDVFRANGIDFDVHEDFESSSRKGVVRGLHFQSREPQSKLVRAVRGKIFDVVVDLRPQSATFGKWEGVYLDSEIQNALLIPAGFAHGFMVVSENALVSYKCCGKYLKEYDAGIIWNDPDIGIDWPYSQVGEITVSYRDRNFRGFADFAAHVGLK